MLVQFKFNNFKCFKDEALLNLVASNYFKEESNNIVSTPFYSVVKTAAIYGANASGKTKLFLAFDFMRSVVLHSANNVNNNIWQNKYDTFRLSTESREASSSFEVVFIIDNVQYRYGFELDKNEIYTEWLFRKKSKEIKVFYQLSVLTNFGGHCFLYNKQIGRKYFHPCSAFGHLGIALGALR